MEGFEARKFCKTHPCKNCPFKKTTLKGWLGRERAEEIAQAESFVCHKTLRPDLEEEGKTDHRKQCAGFMILKKEEAQAVLFARVLGIDLKLTGAEEIFDSKEDFINHHDHKNK